MTYKKKFNIGSLELANNILYAPLAEYSDFAFRKLIRHLHKGLMFCEMIKMDALIREKSCSLLKYTEDMRPIGAQICGFSPKTAKEAAKKIEDMGFDVIDFNCGCPVQKVVKDGSGAAMLKNPEIIGEVISAMSSSVKIPVTVKIRLGWDDQSTVASDVVKIAQQAKAKAITIHARTRKQGYSGDARWDYLKECKKVAKDILVIGNGDLYSAQDVQDMFEKTNVDGVMIARGMLKSPWISEDIEALFSNKEISRTPLFTKEVLLSLIEYILIENKKTNPLFDIRRISAWLLKGCRNIKKLRIAINAAPTANAAIELIKNFEWENERDYRASCNL